MNWQGSVVSHHCKKCIAHRASEGGTAKCDACHAGLRGRCFCEDIHTWSDGKGRLHADQSDPRREHRLIDHSGTGFLGRISDLLKFLVPKVGESFVLGHNVESQEVAQARPRPELAGALETILELAAL